MLMLCMARDPPRIHTMLAWNTLVFHRPSRHRAHLVRSAVRCSASRMKGRLHPTNSLSCEDKAGSGARRAATGKMQRIIQELRGGVGVEICVIWDRGSKEEELIVGGGSWRIAAGLFCSAKGNP